MLGSVATLVLILAGCSSGTTVAAPTASTTVPTTTAAVPYATSEAPATAAPVVSAAASAGATPISDGTYRTQAIPIARVIAGIKADSALSADDKAQIVQGFSGHETEIISLDFSAGQFTESDAFDGGGLEVGARATYAFPDDHTLVIQEQCCGLSTFDITPVSGGFSLKYKAGAPNAGEDVVGQTVYESSQFTLVP